ncbi:DUF87 domain-containing protein, partial [Candidatus Poribacteria bacterium]|nr:DUF87 domain-containing protein [Candidatus Poribacteria bacterium]
MISWIYQTISNAIAKIVVYVYNFIQNLLWQLENNEQIDTAHNDLLLLGKVSREYYPDRNDNSFITNSIRLRHTYILGATGSGKTNLMESFIRQDIEKENGFCLIDCHGDLANNIISYIASLENKHLAENTILIEPFNKKWIVGFNPLRVEDNQLLYPKAIEILSIFQKIWGKDIFGPRTNELFRNTLLTLMDNNLTLLEATELLSNDYFRNSLIENISISEVKNYWLYRYNHLSEKMKAMYREAVINKLTVFTSDPQIKLMLGATENNFDFEKAINDGKWVILNLTKG